MMKNKIIKKLNTKERFEMILLLLDLEPKCTNKMATKQQYYKMFLNSLRERADFLLNGSIEDPIVIDPNPTFQQGDNFKIGDWDDTPSGVHLNHVIYYLNSQWWLVRVTDNGNSIEASGINLLTDTKTSNINIPSGIVISSPETQIGGLVAPDNFPFASMLAVLGENYEMQGTKFIHVSTVTPPSSDSDLVAFAVESTNNTLNLTQFDSITLPDKFNLVYGFGSPIYTDMGERNGNIIQKEVGITHLFNSHLYPLNKWADVEGGVTKPRMAYRFNQFWWMVNEAVQTIKGQNGFTSNDGYWQGLDNQGQNFNGVTADGAIKIGQEIGASHANYYPVSGDTFDWNNPIAAPGRYLFMDEETYNTSDSNYQNFISGVLKGISLANTDIKVMYYGVSPIVWWLMARPNTMTLTDSDIESFFNVTSIFNDSKFQNTKVIVNINFGYYKVPGLENEEIYKKTGENYQIVGGKRLYRDDNFTVNHFGQDVTILAEPHDWIKYWLMNENTGQQAFGSSYIDNPNTESATIKPEYYNQGFRFFTNSRPFPSNWNTESELYVQGVYRYANSILANMLLLNKAEFNDWNITDFRDRNLEFGSVRCPNTEPFTPFGNSIARRQTGKELVLFEYLFGICSGITTMESWQDGYDLTPSQAKIQGNPVYGTTDAEGQSFMLNNSPYVLHVAAFQSVFKNIQGVNPSTFKYIHFYYPFKGEKNSEIIASGIYTGTKFIAVFFNPTLGKNEGQNFILKVGATEFNLQLVGKKVLFKEFTVAANIAATAFSLNYFNIYNVNIKVNGKITENISAHYI